MELTGMEPCSHKIIRKLFNDLTCVRISILCPVQKVSSREGHHFPTKGEEREAP